MADPHHVEQLDDFDASTVRIYRAGLALAAVGVFMAGGVQLAGALDRPLGTGWMGLAWILTTYGTAASIVNMHLYDKRIRSIVHTAGWLGILLLFTATLLVPSAARWVHHAGLGFTFVALSAFALKEQFCFRVPLLKGVPLLLAGSLLPLLFGPAWLAAALLLGAGGILGALAVVKQRMPLHYDIGDKSRYQI